MFEAEYLLFCAGKSTDERGTLSLHGIFDTIYASNFPTQQRPFNIMAKLTAKKAVVNQQLGIRILVELQNKEMNRLDMKGDFTVEKGNSLVPGFDVGQFVFPSPGIYHVKLYVNNKPLITRSLRVRSVGELTEK